jgi:hypothetical protein
VLEGSWSAPLQVDTFELTSAQDDRATQLYDLAAGLGSRLSGLNADRVVIRRADRPQRPSNAAGPRVRLLAEGALASSARAAVDDVVILNGKDLASRSPASSRDALDAHASTVLPTSQTEAAAAALVGLL